jgi:catechol 2,3-dioxygenase-like lactoylglutathione lyase family enzyme
VKIDHLTVPVSDYEHSKRFYAEVLEPLGFAILLDWYEKRCAYLGVPPETSSLWLVESDLNGTLEIALAAPNVDAVDAFHAAATAAGARTLNGPGIRPECSNRYNAARVLDRDGYSLDAVHRIAGPETRAAA